MEEGVELRMERLNLSLRGTTEEAMPLRELQRVPQHVQLREWGLMGLRTPVLLDVAHHATPGLDVTRCPVAAVEQRTVQLLQPAAEEGVGGHGRRRNVLLASSGSEQLCAALLLDPLADLRPVEVVQVCSTAAASGVHGGDGLQCGLDAILAQQLAERIEDDAIADAQEEMQRSGHDALRRNGEERLLAGGM